MSHTAQVAGAIHSAEDFLAALKTGDTFYYMSSRSFRPYTIEGPYALLGLVKMGKQGFLNVKCTAKGSSSGRLLKIDYFSVNDLTNEHHGVFLNPEEAWAYFREARAAYDAAHADERKKTR